MFNDPASPFADRLGTNYVPSEEEIKDLHGLLADPIEQLAKIQAQIDEMDLVVGQLKAKRDSLKTAIDAQMALISPMRHIPDDVLREIFFACLPTAHNALVDINEPPLLFGRICRRWRAVSYSTPMLWTSVHIPPLKSDWTEHHDSTDFFPQLQPVIEQWFERGAPCPLAVSLVETSRFGSDPEPYPIPYSKIARSVSNIWCCMETSDISIVARGTVSFAEYPDAMNLLQLPSITALSLKVMAYPLSLPLKWSQLTDLTLQCFHYSLDNALDGVTALEVLRRCPNLFRCQLLLNKSPADSSLTSNASLITLPNLHTLILGGSFYFPKWIPHLAIPKIRWLHIGDGVETSWFTKFPNLYHSSFGAAVDTSCFKQPGLLELLQCFPLISHLQFASPNYIKALLPDDAFLLHLASEHDICPMLTHVCVTSRCSAFSDTTALTFITGRMAAPTPLQVFDVQFLRTMEVDIMPDLQTSISVGLQVFLDYPSPRFDARAGL
ncbi:hypothetical protein C8R45DRAFT_1182207 [Mycena sanguinolenta]|nr:hypothetical protein C8R45DRAFT_1182207 [Mycena sanguinolenta]